MSLVTERVLRAIRDTDQLSCTIEGLTTKGSHLFVLVSEDDDGLLSEPATTGQMYARDLTPPQIPRLSADEHVRADPTYRVNGTTEPGARVELLLGGVVNASTDADDHGQFEFAIRLREGWNYISCRAIDRWNNTSNRSLLVKVRLDTVHPFIEWMRPGNGSHVDRDQGFEFRVSEPLAAEGLDIAMVDREGVIRPSRELEEGHQYTVTIRGTDPAGNGFEERFEYDVAVHRPGGRTTWTFVVLVVLLTCLAIAYLIWTRRGRK